MTRTHVFGLTLLGAALTGCYTLQPVGAAPAPGTEVAFDVNDVGRVALGASLGPEVRQLEGRVISTENNEYVLAVSAVRFLNGGEQAWAGEQVRVNSAHVSHTYVRRFSTGRTAAFAAATMGSVVAFLVTRSLIGGGSTGGGGIPPDTTSSLTRPSAARVP